MKPDPPDKWSANYRTSKGDFYTIADTTLKECPRSFITADSIELIQLTTRLNLAKEKTGACAFGPDLSKYPSRLLDAFIVLEREERKIEHARYEAERSDGD